MRKFKVNALASVLFVEYVRPLQNKGHRIRVHFFFQFWPDNSIRRQRRVRIAEWSAGTWGGENTAHVVSINLFPRARAFRRAQYGAPDGCCMFSARKRTTGRTSCVDSEAAFGWLGRFQHSGQSGVVRSRGVLGTPCVEGRLQPHELIPPGLARASQMRRTSTSRLRGNRTAHALLAEFHRAEHHERRLLRSAATKVFEQLAPARSRRGRKVR